MGEQLDHIDWQGLWEMLSGRFRLGDFSLHGPTHWKRVEQNALALAQRNGAEVVVVRLFAVFHDAERENESHDPEHGQRAAKLVESLHGHAFQLDETQLNQLKYACAWHHRGQVSDDVTVGTCWDADRLDLPRVGMPPDPKYMSTAEGRQWAAKGALL